jgi:pyruvate/2-oxoglutarate dehydrogenase complex dihydrolipoamide dehydrogenase (E3) component/uncharacterized membrane protein YdjX (TVP38/TMEM64 family)
VSRGKWALLALLLAAVAAFFILDLGQYFSLAYLKGAQGRFQALYAERPLTVIAAYAGIYTVVFALALPVGAVMTLVGGALFGFWVGTLVVSFASTLGATLAFLAVRYLFADAARRRLGARLAEVDKGVQREGAFYLFTLRLIPVVPPALINVLFGLTQLRTWTFAWVSQLGMLAGTAVYVNAGTQLARIESLRGILSPGLGLSLVLLGLFPLLARRIVDGVKARRVYAPWAGRKPSRYDRNMVVIGAGSAGLVTAYIAAAVKARVTLVEAHRMGGDCLNTGCVPSKALIRTATLFKQMRSGAEFGITSAGASLDFARVMQRVAEVVREIEPHDSVERYTALGVDVRIGHAKITSPWHVQITAADGRVDTLSTRAIVIASGAAPFVPPLPGIHDVGVLTSDTLWGLQELPPKLLVLGGGPIGCELAQAFARLGSAVTQVEMAPRLLVREDDEVCAFAQQALEADGVQVLTGHEALRFEIDASGGKWLVARAAGQEVRIGFDTLLCAVGRAARLSGFGLEELGIPVQRTVTTDAWLQTIFPNILAAGDVAGPWQFTHAAAHQAWYAAVNGLFAPFKRFKLDTRVMPACTFIDPEVARVGLNEREAQAQDVAYETTRFEMAELDRAIADGRRAGWVKVLTVPGRDRILGVTIIGAHAGELLAEYVLAMKHGLGLNKILGTIHSYPTLAEANKSAAGAWKRAHQPLALLRWVERFHAWRRGGGA